MIPVDHAYISHRIPERVRYKVIVRRGDVTYFANAATKLRSLTNVQRVEVNPDTASILVYTRDADMVTEFCEREGLFQIGVIGPRSVSHEFRLLGQDFARFVNIDPGTLAFASLVLMSVIQIFRGEIMPPAATTLWYATDVTRRRL